MPVRRHSAVPERYRLRQRCRAIGMKPQTPAVSRTPPANPTVFSASSDHPFLARPLAGTAALPRGEPRCAKPTGSRSRRRSSGDNTYDWRTAAWKEQQLRNRNRDVQVREAVAVSGARSKSRSMKSVANHGVLPVSQRTIAIAAIVITTRLANVTAAMGTLWRVRRSPTSGRVSSPRPPLRMARGLLVA